MSVITRGKTIRLQQLQAEMVAAGIDVGLGLALADDVISRNVAGPPSDLGTVAVAAAFASEAAAQAVVDAHVAVDPAVAIRAAIVTLAQSAVGVQLNALSQVQVRALMACLLFKAGGVHPDMSVAPLSEWLQ
jgi:hypothetical protein